MKPWEYTQQQRDEDAERQRRYEAEQEYQLVRLFFYALVTVFSVGLGIWWVTG